MDLELAAVRAAQRRVHHLQQRLVSVRDERRSTGGAVAHVACIAVVKKSAACQVGAQISGECVKNGACKSTAAPRIADPARPTATVHMRVSLT